VKACVISLGCPKNLCDSEVLMGKLVASGYELTAKEKEADLIIVNTCAFLKSAREESYKEIRRVKKTGKKVYLAGCLPKWRSSHPSPSGRGKEGEGVINSLGLFNCSTPRIKATPPWTAYVKIAEGCNNRCSYCLIPSIRGKLRTRKVADILAEVKDLARKGVKEVIFIAQDTTAHPQLAPILRKSAKVKGIRWIRLMYAHPAHLTDETIKTIKTNKTIVKYLDLPIQHCCDKILASMNRPYNGIDITHLISKLRREIRGLKLRTSLMVGFPGETQQDFEELLDFIKDVRFERLGVFEYSRESGTPAAKLRGQVPNQVKRSRFHKLMTQQNRISREQNRKMIGQTLEILCESPGRGRAAFDAPEIDGSVKFYGKARPGEFVKVKITSASAYGLTGHATHTSRMARPGHLVAT
jgi:ribosomal protein S12 methylthiotransferase